MLTGRKIILFGAGIVGRRALNFFGSEKVYCFADNFKAGQTFWSKPVISFNELKNICDDYDIVLTANLEKTSELEEQCQKNMLCYSVFSRLISYGDYESNPDIRQFEGKHKGERCFLVGNGPSLAAEDLTRLYENGETSFACNAISKIYGQTVWRPRYYMVWSPVYLLECEMLARTEADYKFFPETSDIYAKDTTEIKRLLEKEGRQIIYYRSIIDDHTTQEPRFSSDVSRAFYASSTIMYSMIQFAVYMGFVEIILLGVDGTTSMETNPEEYLSAKRHFYNDNENIIRQRSKIFSLLGSEVSQIRIKNAYEKANKYTNERGIRILNATRGGMIETFERVDFNSLF